MSSSKRCVSSPSKEIDLRNLAGMMRSVSMSLPRSGSPRPEAAWMRSIAMRCEVPDVDDFAGHGGGGNHGWTHQKRPSGGAPLPPLEIPVRGRGADLPAFELVLVHRQTHRAAGAAPFEAGLREHTIEPFALGRGTYRL